MTMRNTSNRIQHWSRNLDTCIQWGRQQETGDFLDTSFPHTHAFTSIVDLHLLAEVNVHRLNVGVVVQGVLSQLATNCKFRFGQNQIRRREREREKG